jgi:hypothetical protein
MSYHTRKSTLEAPASSQDRSSRRATTIYIGMKRLATAEELDSVREAVLADNVPLAVIDAQRGGKYGYYMVLKFEPGWNDFIKSVDIAKFLQMEFGSDEEVPLEF